MASDSRSAGGSDDEVVEVETPCCGECALVGDEGPRRRTGLRVGGDRLGIDPDVELEARDHRVQPPSIGGGGSRERGAEDGLRSSSGATGRPASRRISSPRAWNVLTRTVGTAPLGSIPPVAGIGASAASSRSDSSSAARRLKVIAAMEVGSTPESTSHATRATSGRGLPAPRRRHTQHRARRRRRRRALVRREARQPLGNRPVEIHPAHCARAGSTGHLPASTRHLRATTDTHGKRPSATAVRLCRTACLRALETGNVASRRPGTARIQLRARAACPKLRRSP